MDAIMRTGLHCISTYKVPFEAIYITLYTLFMSLIESHNWLLE